MGARIYLAYPEHINSVEVMMVHSIHQEISCSASPARVYEVLTDASEFSKLSGGLPSEINANAGGSFSFFGGMIIGRNIECIPGERLVQAWRVKTWEPGVYSIVRFELKQEDNGTRIVLVHNGFPEEHGEHLSEGWHENYWVPMNKMLSGDRG
jgi:activator of HSP90 ATPase